MTPRYHSVIHFFPFFLQGDLRSQLQTTNEDASKSRSVFLTPFCSFLAVFFCWPCYLNYIIPQWLFGIKWYTWEFLERQGKDYLGVKCRTSQYWKYFIKWERNACQWAEEVDCFTHWKGIDFLKAVMCKLGNWCSLTNKLFLMLITKYKL